MKKTQVPYTNPELTVILLSTSDIVTASGIGGTLSNDSSLTYDDGGWT